MATRSGQGSREKQTERAGLRDNAYMTAAPIQADDHSVSRMEAYTVGAEALAGAPERPAAPDQISVRSRLIDHNKRTPRDRMVYSFR